MTGEEGDISNLCQFDWYQWCYFREQKSDCPLAQEVLGRVLGLAKGEGNEILQWVLKANGNVVPRRTTRPINSSELSSQNEKRKRNVFDELITERWGTPVPAKTLNDEEDPATHTYDDKEDPFGEYEDEDESPRVIPEMDDPIDAAGNVINQETVCDKMIQADLILPQGNKLRMEKVRGRTVGPDGKKMGPFMILPYLTRSFMMLSLLMEGLRNMLPM